MPRGRELEAHDAGSLPSGTLDAVRVACLGLSSQAVPGLGCHPLDYAAFEGPIHAGEYGGGTVMVWDRGRWYPDRESAEDPRKAYDDGALQFRLEGGKLHGGRMLIRLKGRPAGKARTTGCSSRSATTTRAPATRRRSRSGRPVSALTGRTMEQIAAGAPPLDGRRA
jgi:bifunctional non-homologous end joining protein LigD